MIKYISVDELLNEVENTLYSYYQAGTVDNSHCYPVIIECLSKLGTKIYSTTDVYLDVRNYKVLLPKDFYKLIYAVGCDYIKDFAVKTESPQLFEMVVGNVFQVDYPIKLRNNDRMCEGTCGEVYEVVQRVEGQEIAYADIFPLKLKSSNFSVSGCKNLFEQSEREIKIENGYIYTNFPEGTLYVRYMQNIIVNDVDIMIPDYPKIKEWIKSVCIKTLLEKIYYNGESDVLQRLQYANQQLSLKELNAMSFIKMVDREELYAFKNYLFQRAKKYENIIK